MKPRIPLQRLLQWLILLYGLFAAATLFTRYRSGWVPYADGRAGLRTDPQRGFQHK